MAIIDGFSFFNELELLELRLHTLDPVVDQFILVEARTTHSGKPKPLYYEDHKSDFKRWSPKIKHIVIEFDTSLSVWEKERYQRDRILVSDLSGHDLLYISDVDEIWNPKRAGQLGIYKQDLYTGYFNVQCPYPWHGTTALSAVTWDMNGPSSVRQSTHAGHMRFPTVQDGGWHFSSIGGPARVIQKLESFAHQEYNTEQVKADVSANLDRMMDIYGRGEQYSLVDVPDVVKGLPNYQDYCF